MKRIAVKLWFVPPIVAALILLAAFDVSADKIWLTPTNGFWHAATNWSGGAAPSGGTNATAVWLTNANSKVVTIDATTLSPENKASLINETLPLFLAATSLEGNLTELVSQHHTPIHH